MIKIKPAFLLLLIFLMGNAGFALAESDTIPPQIINPDIVAVNYCSDSILVAPNITIQNIKIDEASEGMKVSIATNYERGEDILVWDAVGSFSYSWSSSYGYLQIKGVGSESQYQEAISKVYYKNIAEKPRLGPRSFSISLTDADYLPKTEHFYRYIEKLDITWKEAKAAADTMKYYGLQGYLATISSSVENDFIWTKIDGVGWIGATDEEREGDWKWATGPEAGTLFWKGTSGGAAVAGRYSFWNSGEPNNVEKVSGVDEDYAHINANPGSVPKSWNDLPNAGDGPSSKYYRAQGFIVEFGEMPKDPLVKLSASAIIQVRKIAFADERDFDICEGESQELNVKTDSYTYSWTPDHSISSIWVSNPLVSPHENTTYTVIGNLDFCTDTAEFNIQVNPLPISLLPADTTICKGEAVTLDPGVHSSYLWSNGDTSRTITVVDEANYWVKLKNDFTCELADTVEVKWSVRPELDYSTVDTLVCGSKIQTLNLSFVGVTASTVLIALDSRAKITAPTSLNPTIKVDEFGKYQFEMQIEDGYGCNFLDTLTIEFHNQPKAVISMDDEKCKGYSLYLSFGGTTKEEALFSWYYNDSIFGSGINVYDTIIPLGYGELERSVGLIVNEQGCLDSTVEAVTVTPNVSVSTDIDEGCSPLNVMFTPHASEEIDSYLWDLGNGESGTEDKTSAIYSNDTIVDVSYDVALTVRSTEGCENTGVYKSMITVHPKPTVDLSFHEDDCNAEQMKIWYVGSANAADSLYWDLTSLLPSEILNAGAIKDTLEIKRSSEPSAEIGIHVVSEFGCNSDTISKLWKRKPAFELVVDTTEGCPPLAVFAEAIVLDSVDNVRFSYNLGDGALGEGNEVKHVYSTAGTENEIQFIGKSVLTACSDTVLYHTKVEVYPAPKANFIPQPEAVLISDPEIYFENTTTGAINAEWFFDDGSVASSEMSPTHRFSEMGIYNVLLIAASELGCLDSVSRDVAVTFDRLFPPNAFSPNATLLEDREFRIYAEGVADEGYQLLIFNRWGEILFESNSQKVGWDGKMKNDNYAPAGVYTWVLQYSDFRGEMHKQQGVVSLII